nr:MAG TPA: hypothetical protein [Caudoviricetes sp.]
MHGFEHGLPQFSCNSAWIYCYLLLCFLIFYYVFSFFILLRFMLLCAHCAAAQ